MSVQILIGNSVNPDADYITWTPSRCTISSTDGLNKRVVLQNVNAATGGQVVFKQHLTDPVSNSIELETGGSGDPVSFYIAGKFDRNTGIGHASIRDKDCIIAVIDRSSSAQIGSKALMVRVRKDANTLTPSERDRYLAAIVRLTQLGRYVDFQNMHTAQADPEIHRRSSFLVWHRAYLLDFERKLQEIDPSVTLPYWRFDKPAPNVFSGDFVGVPDRTGLIEFSNTNPLINWRPTIFGQGTGRIRRVPFFDTRNEKAAMVQNDEMETISLGSQFRIFRRMEGDPHGGAHLSFDGPVSEIDRAPADPLFFMLHANVDRLWAKWQWVMDGQRFDFSSQDAYPHQGNGNTGTAGEFGIGNFTDDTMWPWNGDFIAPRPTTGPRGTFPDSPIVQVPGLNPDLKSMIDYQGQHNLASNLCFAYDDVPFDHPGQVA
ncbi:tyrosinase family protein [Rufibacter tibetensis]|uniref:Tyrosinase copper-binding domain-containing protein n=1 Tax=Rufibacter tibetensis TaxID=512763 RepID=A0A0P0BZ27_9BACT|nr:tyrosinase family protein [Rufibacter tibetensis]ALI97726.1 hypothetical protein DC20_00365 [Rufibacter tibetensis]